MFTGLIETLGTIVSFEQRGAGCLIGIRPEKGDFTAPVGASVAIDGACLTVEVVKGPVLYFAVVPETLDRTTIARERLGGQVNLERPLAATGRLDGHLVLGHVDGVGVITRDRAEGASTRRTIEIPVACLDLMAEKGSVAIDGISLTIAEVKGNEISVALVPRTLEITTMREKRVGDRVNIECDVIARYVQKLLSGNAGGETGPARGPTLYERLEGAGF
jgi:riboflavin synthase